MANDPRRLELHEKLCEVLGSRHVYFQPPESIKLEYPCIVYKRSYGDSKYANDKTYHFTNGYEVTGISRDPDSSFIDDMIATFPLLRFNRHFTSDNLNHDVFILYY